MLLEDRLIFLLGFLYHSERYVDNFSVMALQTTNNDR